MSEALDTAYQQGREAYSRGEGRLSNPFEDGDCEQWESWREGWYSAKIAEQRKERD